MALGRKVGRFYLQYLLSPAILFQTEVEESLQESGGFSDIIRSKPNRKSVALCIGLVAIQQLSGEYLGTHN